MKVPPHSIAAPGFGAASSGSREGGDQDEEGEEDWGHVRMAEIGEARVCHDRDLCLGSRIDVL